MKTKLLLLMVATLLFSACADDLSVSSTPVSASTIPAQQSSSPDMLSPEDYLNELFSDEKIPTTAELQTFHIKYPEESAELYLPQLQEIINNVSSEEIYTMIENDINTFMQAQEIMEIESYDIDFNLDDLLLVDGKDEQSYQDIIVNLDIHYNTENFSGETYVVLDEFAKVNELIFANVFSFYKVREINISLFNQNNNEVAVDSHEIVAIFTNTPLKDNSSPAMLKAQTVVYNFVNEFAKSYKTYSPEALPVYLMRFGEKDDILFIEVNVFEPKQDISLEEFLLELDEKSLEIESLVKNNADILQYIEENEISSAKLQFKTLWHPEFKEYITYTFEL